MFFHNLQLVYVSYFLNIIVFLLHAKTVENTELLLEILFITAGYTNPKTGSQVLLQIHRHLLPCIAESIRSSKNKTNMKVKPTRPS